MIETRRVVGAEADRRKRKALSDAGRANRPPPALLLKYHDELLYLCAFPTSASLLRNAQRELARLGRLVAAGAVGRRALRNSGIAGSDVVFCPSLDLARWLAQRADADVEIDLSDEQAVTALEDLIPRLLDSVEADGFQTDRLSTKAWFRLGASRRNRPVLRDVVALFDRAEGEDSLRDAAFESLELPVRWRLARSSDSRTGSRFPKRPTFFHRAELLRHANPGEWLARPLPAPLALTPARRNDLLDVARVALAVRRRETDAITYANPREVAFFRLERGIDVALFGMRPERRLPVESYFGYVAARNRVPVAYGGGWVFCGRCEIGINLFPEFRGGESTPLFAQILRVYAQHYRVQQFRVDPYQFGADNDEAIQSAAFWFYYRFGFRPAIPSLAALAEREAARLRGDPRYRSSVRTLRRLAGGPIRLDVPRRGVARRFESDTAAPDLTQLGLRVTERIGRHFRGDRGKATAWAVRRVLRLAGLDRRVANRVFGVCVARLAPLIASLPGIERWPAADRRALGRIMLAKSGPAERDYALQLAGHARLRAALASFAAG